MNLNKWHAEQLNKYSFIDKAELRFTKLYIYYTVKGVEKSRWLHIRNNVDKLQKVVKEIEIEVGVSKYGKGYSAIFTSAD